MYFPFLHVEGHIIIGQYQGELLADIVHFNGVLHHSTISSIKWVSGVSVHVSEMIELKLRRVGY